MPFVSNLSEVRTHCLLFDTCMLFSHSNAESNKEAIELNIQGLKASKSITLLWATDLTLLKLTKEHRDQLFTQVDGIVAINEHIKNVLSAYYFCHIGILRLPAYVIKQNHIKQPLVTVVNDIDIYGTPFIVSLFEGLSSNIDKVFIGKAINSGYTYLEGELLKVCKWYPEASRHFISDIASKTSIYVHINNQNINPIWFTTFALSGSWIFASKGDIVFDEYKSVQRFNNVSDAVAIIETYLGANKLADPHIVYPDIIEKHSVGEFKQSLQKTFLEINNV